VKELKKLDLAEIRQKTQDYIAASRLKAQIHAIVREALQAYDGKVINKRMATAVEKALEAKLGKDLSVMWRTEYSWNSIRVWGDQKSLLPYTGCYDQMVNYHSDKGPKSDGRFYFDYWVEKYEAKTGNTRFTEWADESEAALRMACQKVAAYNKAIDDLEQAKENLKGLATWS
jgi:hypothetical protein